MLVVGSLLTVPTTASAAEDLLVSVPGTFNSEVGCPDDWQPECAAVALALRANDGIYSATFEIPAGSWAYKIAIGGTWDVNYGKGGVQNGPDITFTTTTAGPVTFFYDPESHLMSSTAEGPIVTVPGSFQSELGCPSDWAPDCMKTWLTDPDGDGTYTFSTTEIPDGSNWEAKVTHGLSWDENWGAAGLPGGANMPFSASAGSEVTFSYVLSTHVLTITTSDPPLPGIGTLQAFWVDQSTLAWPTSLLAGAEPDQLSWQLYHSPTAGIFSQDGAVAGGTAIELSYDPAGLTTAQITLHPELTGYLALRPAGLDPATIGDLLTEQVLVAQFGSEGTVSALTGVQLPGVLDELYGTAAAGRTLGPDFSTGTPTITVWAPTAQHVELQLFAGDATAPTSTVPATRNDDGTWSVTGDAYWRDIRYLFAVTVYAPSVQQVVTNVVTDPYSVGLTMNSTYSVAVDLNDPAYRPAAWESTAAPVIANPVDRTIYELHIRDFSMGDPEVPEKLQGTYSAFAFDRGAGTKHLKQLVAAGLNTVHLLPSFDIASIEEHRAAQLTPDCDLASFAPDSEQQQACVKAVAGGDGYNWGYDPWHFSTPEGSYAQIDHQDGGARTADFRDMVGALHADGLQVVLDQVFNHTAASGQADKSVLDQVVPGYYQRLDRNGAVYTSTCCQNVATEHAMAQRLMVDSVVTWARDYKVDGFRFDLMGHHSKDNMLAVRAALDALTPSKDGIDGSKIYLYGEGWNFGEVQDNALFYQATQGQLGGTGIGTFNDRMRDGVNGGSPVDGDSYRYQGFGNGLGTDPNGSDQGASDLGQRTDWVRLGLAGNLRSFTFLTSAGTEQRGDEIDYNGSPAGYADEPDEVINYVDAHDNQTLFDMLTVKLPHATSMDDRVRMNTLSLATVMLSQGIPFWHAGTDLLRSKSLDHNSYDSGDWFNAIDWTGQDIGFGRGLPPAPDNEDNWPVDRPLLADPALKPTSTDIIDASSGADALLQLRSSTALFRLGNAELINQKLAFQNSGPGATPGVIVMSIDDTVGADADPALDGALVVFNASPAATSQQIGTLAGRSYQLADIQAGGRDPVVKTTTWDAATGTVTVPARTVAVLVSKTVGSSVSLTATPAEQIFGSPDTVTLTATVTADGGQPTGSVEFRSGDTVLGTAPVTAGTATLRLPANTPAGTLSVVAHYSGDGRAPPADSAAVTVTVRKAGSAVALFGIPLNIFGAHSGPLLVGFVQLDNGRTARGSIQIADNGTVLGTVGLTGGIAVFTVPKNLWTSGIHRFVATYQPADAANVTGSSSPQLIVRR